MNPIRSTARRTVLRAVAAATMGAALMPAAFAADKFPSKPITMVVPFVAGGTTDILARIVGQSLGEELGLYSDPYDHLGYLQVSLLRTVRLVADTGRHAAGWSRQQAIDYMVRNADISAADAAAEVERFMALPGQTLAYRVGEIKIRRLREKAQAALGERFDPREFHNEVLKDGSMPLDILEAKIDRWIASKQN